ncbi:MAG TPA: ribose 5-phosphate isomerase B [Candidatus Pelethenecus faecipullorum]|uniref:Ribose 5-phosphate isomerase B n=1 Tax=Candidatus Pelethenecus faecipullorum TaxID=2840900 RepID=A0A9D1GRG0_9MOLU|nr:ribose 5-phosphate isomerase B [Candidatus Pelethenecus faecipullorum]
MKIAIGCDHSALEMKEMLIPYLKSLGHAIIDQGCFTKESCDYTDYGYQVAKAISDNAVDRGIVICSTGIGMSIIANKVEGVRCALVLSKDAAVLTREHNDSNCLALSAKYTGFALAREIVALWLDTPFSNNSRHQRRIKKITDYEKEGKDGSHHTQSFAD